MIRGTLLLPTSTATPQIASAASQANSSMVKGGIVRSRASAIGCSAIAADAVCDATTVTRSKPLAAADRILRPNSTQHVGGVDVSELESRTMQSRRVPGLYFVGEVVDVSGWLGGYNFQWAWASGHAAGQALCR